MTVLENYRMVSQSQVDLVAELQQLDAKIENSADPVVKQESEHLSKVGCSWALRTLARTHDQCPLRPSVCPWIA